jgi:hypothetical protein
MQLHVSERREMNSRYPHVKTSESRHSRLAALIRIWTIKEGFTKALGLGLSLDFTRIRVLLSPTFDDASSDERRTSQPCERCRGAVDLDVDGRTVDPSWHIRLGTLRVGDTMDERYLWCAAWRDDAAGSAALPMCGSRLEVRSCQSVVEGLLVGYD